MSVSDELLQRYREMAAGGLQFHGLSILQHKDEIRKLVKRHGVQTILDFGSGRGDAYKSPHKLHHEWGLKRSQVTLYDPAFPNIDKMPAKVYDAVVCSDVLEHVPEDEVSIFLTNLVTRARKFVWASVCCRAARKSFPGTDINLHVTVQPFEWWQAQTMHLASGHGIEFILVETP